MGDGARSMGMNLSFCALTWALVSMLLPADLAFRVLVMLSGRSPNLQGKMRAFQEKDQEALGPQQEPLRIIT